MTMLPSIYKRIDLASGFSKELQGQSFPSPLHTLYCCCTACLRYTSAFLQHERLLLVSTVAGSQSSSSTTHHKAVMCLQLHQGMAHLMLGLQSCMLTDLPQLCQEGSL